VTNTSRFHQMLLLLNLQLTELTGSPHPVEVSYGLIATRWRCNAIFVKRL